jgi:hypothetical protein
MPIELRYREGGRGVVFVCAGVVTGTEFDEANEEIYSDQCLPALRYQLIDFSDAERIEISAEDTRRHAEVDRVAAERNPNIAIAIVGPSDVTFGISRMWQALTDDSKLQSHIFRSMPEAERCLAETSERSGR